MEIALGLFLLIVLLLCIGGAIGVLILPDATAPKLEALCIVLTQQPERSAICVILALVCLWGISVSIRLIRGQDQALLSPRALRLASWLFIIMPVSGLFTGYFREKPIPALLGAFCHLCFFFSIRSLAAERERPEPPELDISDL